MSFHVQTHIQNEGWLDCWLVDTESGERPETFETLEAAESEIKRNIASCNTAYAEGLIDECLDRADFRIIKDQE